MKANMTSVLEIMGYDAREISEKIIDTLYP